MGACFPAVRAARKAPIGYLESDALQIAAKASLNSMPKQAQGLEYREKSMDNIMTGQNQGSGVKVEKWYETYWFALVLIVSSTAGFWLFILSK
jgi:hypothetical protein